MCSAQNTPRTRCLCPSQHWLTSALGTSVVSAAGAPLPASQGKRSRSLSPAGKPRFTSRGMLVYPFGNTQVTTCPQRGSTRAGLPLSPSPGSQGRDNPAGAGHREELLLLPGEPLLLTPTLGHPGSGRQHRPPRPSRGKVRGAPQAARGAGGRAGLRQGCASPVQVRHLVPAPLRESRERPGMRREREPEQQEGPSLWSHQHQGWACLSHQSCEATA